MLASLDPNSWLHFGDSNQNFKILLKSYLDAHHAPSFLLKLKPKP
jgi:hypothetical protein